MTHPSPRILQSSNYLHEFSRFIQLHIWDLQLLKPKALLLNANIPKYSLQEHLNPPYPRWFEGETHLGHYRKNEEWNIQ